MLANKRILIVEDSSDLQEVWKTLFEKKGFEITCFTSPKTALGWIKQQQTLPAVVITDFFLPEFNGLEFVNRLRGLSIDIPCIVVTGNEDFLSLKWDFHKHENIHYLEKPVKFQVLHQKVTKLLISS